MNITEASSLGLKVQHIVSVSDIQREQLPTHLASKVRITDPSIWSILYSVDKIMQEVPNDWESLAAKTGFIMIGDAYPRQATQKVIRELQTRNNVSPMSFINANAGAAISICATQYNFQGPSINLTTSAEAPFDIALLLAQQWLQLSDVTMIFLIHAYYQQNALVITNALISS